MDDTRLILQSLLPGALIQIPILLVMLAGVILAIIFWRRNAKVSLLVIAALTLSFVTKIGGMLHNAVVPFLLIRGGLETQQTYGLATCLGIVFSLLNAVALGLLLGAVFSWRKRDNELTEA